MKHPDYLTEAEHIKRCEILRISEDLRKAYALKLSFRKIFSSYGLCHFGGFRVRILLLSKKNGTNHTYDWCQKRIVG